MFRFYYIDDDPGGGGGDKPKAPTAPQGYTVTTPQQRSEWNGFLDYMGKQGVAGKSDLDAPGAGLKYFQQYKKDNPDISLTPEHIQNIQYEQYLLRKGDQFNTLNKMQLDHLRSGLSPDYLNKPLSEVNGQVNSATSQLYYPSGKNYGTDLENYDKTLGTPATAIPTFPTNPVVVPATGGGKPSTPGPGPIPLPDYNDPKSRAAYLKQWAKKYGDLEGRGDTILKLNEIPRTGSDTAENLAKKMGEKYGVDPALLHTSVMEEGMSGLFKDKSGLDTKHRKPGEFGYMDYYGDKDFPINGGLNFGFNTFAERFPELVANGYLPKNFASQFRGKARAGEHSENNFKSVDAALEAKAAMMKYGQDYVEKQAQKHDIKLSPAQRDFFTLAWFNGGEGGVLSRLVPYAKKGYLKDDKFLEKRPKEEEGKPDNLDVYGHVVRRIKMRDNLKREGYFQQQQ